MWIWQKKWSELTDHGGFRPGAVQEVVQVVVDDVRVKVGAALNQQAGFCVSRGRGHRQGEGSRLEAGRLAGRHGGDAAVGGKLLCSRGCSECRRCQLICFCTKRSTVSGSSASSSVRRPGAKLTDFNLFNRRWAVGKLKKNKRKYELEHLKKREKKALHVEDFEWFIYFIFKVVACLVAWGILVTWSFRNIQGWLFKEENMFRRWHSIQFKEQTLASLKLPSPHLHIFKTKAAHHAGALNTYLTPHVSFADFQSQNFGKVLSQLCDTRILKTEQKRIESPSLDSCSSGSSECVSLPPCGCFKSYFVIRISP